jgi:hypothetical protein
MNFGEVGNIYLISCLIFRRLSYSSRLKELSNSGDSLTKSGELKLLYTSDLIYKYLLPNYEKYLLNIYQDFSV